MNTNIGYVVQKYLKDKIKIRYVIEASDFFNILESMGIMEDTDELHNILEYFDNEKIDMHFNDDDVELYKKFKITKANIEFLKTIKINRSRIKSVMDKSGNLNFQKLANNTYFLKTYKEEIEPEVGVVESMTIDSSLTELHEKLLKLKVNTLSETINKSDEELMRDAINKYNQIKNQE